LHSESRLFYFIPPFELLEEQTKHKLAGQKHILHRIVSLDDGDARPILKGKKFPKCEFGTTIQMTFTRLGFMITTENFIGQPQDKTLYQSTLKLFYQRMGRYPKRAITDQGFRSRKNLTHNPKSIEHIFMGKSEDVPEEEQDYCRSARSATEGFIAVAKNLRGFRKSMYPNLTGHRIWALLCQTAYNLKKFLQLYRQEKIPESALLKLGLLS